MTNLLKKKKNLPFLNEYFKTNEILKKINERAKKEMQGKFTDLYKLMSREDFIYQALSEIKENKEIYTFAHKNELNKFGKKEVQSLIEKIKKEEYRPNPVKRFKKFQSEKKKPFSSVGVVGTILTLEDKIVQQMVYQILNHIYEPIFEKKHENANYGLRKKKSVRQAMEKIYQKAQNTAWCIKGNIEGAYDNVKHGKLLEILQEKISDQKFIKLIKTTLKCGVIIKGKEVMTQMGISQENNASSLLLNIYLSKLDEHIIELIETERTQDIAEGRVPSKKRKAYIKITNEIGGLVRWIKKKEKGNQKVWNKKDMDKLKTAQKKIKNLNAIRLKMESIDEEQSLHRSVYVRYADNWVFMTNGDKPRVERIKERIDNFLKNKLRLKLSEKTMTITNMKKDRANFLGFGMTYNIGRKVITSTYLRTKRTTGQRITIGVDKDKAIKRLIAGGFMSNQSNAIAKKSWTTRTDYEIIDYFNWMTKKMILYWSQGIRHFREIQKYLWILDCACKRTLAKKHKVSSIKIMKKYGNPIKVEVAMEEGIKTITQIGYRKRKEIFNEIRRKREVGSHGQGIIPIVPSSLA